MSAGSSPEPQLVDTAAQDAAASKAFGELGSLELEFERAEVEVLKYQITQTAPLYARRNAILATLPNFWPTVFDCTPDFDQHIAPGDVQAVSAITALNVIRPNPTTEPRDFIIEITFDKERNEWFEEDTIRKQFWWKTLGGDWSGHVSEPVNIKWKEGKDLTAGETTRAWDAWNAKKNGATASAAAEEEKGKGKGKANGVNGKAKKSWDEKLQGGQPSFFTWFAWKGKGTDAKEHEHGENCDHDDEEDEEDDDIFNHGDELALTIADDVYPSAIKYFLESVMGGNSEVDSDMSVSDLEDDEDEDDEAGGSSSAKRQNIDGADEDDSDEDESNSRRKRVKK